MNFGNGAQLVPDPEPHQRLEGEIGRACFPAGRKRKRHNGRTEPELCPARIAGSAAGLEPDSSCGENVSEIVKPSTVSRCDHLGLAGPHLLGWTFLCTVSNPGAAIFTLNPLEQ